MTSEAKKVADFLRKKKSMVLATVTPEGKPHAATVFYEADENFNFYILTSATSGKLKNILHNGHAAFAVGTGPESITVQGGARRRSSMTMRP